MTHAGILRHRADVTKQRYGLGHRTVFIHNSRNPRYLAVLSEPPT
jgi:hypothetical protein